jgi:hypothetical protein
LLDFNNMSYSLETPASLVTQRTDKRLYPQQRVASNGQTITFILNTGTSMVYQLNSGLYVKIEAVGIADALACGFGSGSAMNIVQNIRIYSRSGVELTNTTRMNLYRRFTDKYHESPDWFGNVGSLMGYTDDDSTATFTGTAAGVADRTKEFVIPLRLLHPFFAEMSGRFLPANMASGMRVEIDLESPVVAFQGTTNAGDSPVSYTVQDSYLSLQTVDLMSSAISSLNKQASTSTLEYTYTDIMTARNTVGVSTNININVNKSVSFAMKAVGLLQNAGAAALPQNDSFAAPFLPASYWYSLGSQQMPSNQLIDNTPLSYMMALASYGKLKTPSREGSVSKQNFIDSYGVYAVSLERSDTLQLSSLPINSSRMLRFEATLDAPGVDLVSTIFLTYLANARSSLLNVRRDI